MSTLETRGQYVIERLEAQRRSSWVQVSALLGAATCITLAAALQAPINRQREELELTMHSNIYKDLPPEYAWVSAVGATFRGLAVDILWNKAENLKQEGKYFQSHQLAKWICTIQPRFPAVWDFQAWNLSYNISVGTHTAPERWQWVYNGIRLLRDEGIPNNPRSIALYHRLAWIWFHKVGGITDDFHWDYKRQWAATMETLLGAPPAAVSDHEVVEWFRPVAEAPDRLDEVIQQRPGVAELVSRLNDLNINVHAGTSVDRIEHPLEKSFFLPYTVYNRSRMLRGLLVQPPAEQEREHELHVFFETAPPADFAALLAYLRAKVLREQYKMDPKFMFEISDRLVAGQKLPIDWRTPWAQSLYWGLYGAKQAGGVTNIKPFDLLATDRIALFSLADMMKNGRLLFRLNPEKPMQSFITLMPDTRFIEAWHQKYLEYGPRHSEAEEEDAQAGRVTAEILRDGHVNNLHLAIIALYFEGKKEQANRYLRFLADNYPDPFTRKPKWFYTMGLDDFIKYELQDYLDHLPGVRILCYQQMRQAYLNLANGMDAEFYEAIESIKYLHEQYEKSQEGDFIGRQRLPPLVRLWAEALADLVLDSSLPLPLRSAVWILEAQHNEVRQWSYDDIAPALMAECEREGLVFEKAFPVPEGMEAFRAANPRMAQPDDARKEREQRLRGQEGVLGPGQLRDR
ncbi:MAG: hypothetical protein GXY44_04685 [Phycisphaerales bacterium]|nr:hypothetical protein [Phycisphaerales bacterium]